VSDDRSYGLCCPVRIGDGACDLFGVFGVSEFGQGAYQGAECPGLIGGVDDGGGDLFGVVG
jgi:hypothetical protein